MAAVTWAMSSCVAQTTNTELAWPCPTLSMMSERSRHMPKNSEICLRQGTGERETTDPRMHDAARLTVAVDKPTIQNETLKANCAVRKIGICGILERQS